MEKIKVYRDGEVIAKPTVKKLSKKWRKFNWEDTVFSGIKALIKELFGEDAEIKRKSILAISKETQRQNEEQRKKDYIKKMKIKCAVYNDSENVKEDLSYQLAEIFKPYIGKKLFKADGTRSAILSKLDTIEFDKSDNPIIEKSLKGKLVTESKYLNKLTGMYAHRTNGWLSIDLNFEYKLPSVKDKQYYKTTLYFGILDEEDKQVLEELKIYEKAEPLNHKEEIKLIEKHNELLKQTSEINQKIRINNYFQSWNY